MKKLLTIVLALGLLLGLAACGAPKAEEPTSRETTTQPAMPFDLEAYKAALSEWGAADPVEHVVNPAPHIAEAFQPLQDYNGILPDEAVMAFARYCSVTGACL